MRTAQRVANLHMRLLFLHIALVLCLASTGAVGQDLRSGQLDDWIALSTSSREPLVDMKVTVTTRTQSEGIWSNDALSIEQYDSLGFQTKREWQTWENGAWLPEEQWIGLMNFEWGAANDPDVHARRQILLDFQYSGPEVKGMTLDYSRFEWDETKWENYARVQQIADTAGRIAETVSWSNFDPAVNRVVESSRTLYDYDDAGQVISARSQKKQTANADWLDASRTNYVYQDDRLVAVESETNVLLGSGGGSGASSWENLRRSSIIYDGGAVEYIDQKWDDGQWVNSARVIEYYLEAGTVVETTLQTWDGAEWANLSRRTLTYNEEGRLFEVLNEASVRGGGAEFNPTGRSFVEFNEDGYQWRRQSDVWDGEEWVRSKAEEWVYEDTSPVTSDQEEDLPDASRVWFTTYPNPANETATIAFHATSNGPIDITVFDMLGRVVDRPASDLISSGDQEIEWQIGDLPSGTYLLRLVQSSQVQTRLASVIRD